MDFKKIGVLNKKISYKRNKYQTEKDLKKKRKLFLELQIEELKLRIERLN